MRSPADSQAKHSRPASRAWVAPLLLILIFAFLSIGTYASWQARDVYPLAGDEPHYLGITRGLVEEFTLDQRDVIELEREDPYVFAQSATPLPDQPTPKNFQSKVTPAGWQSIHSIGLPVMLTVPFVAAGIEGARIFLIVMTALCIPIIWWVTGLLSPPGTSTLTRTATTGALSLTAPLVYSSAQVYPDIAAGLVLLLGLAVLLAGERLRRAWVRIAVVVLLALAPWLQLKFVLPALIILAALAWQWRARRRRSAVAAIVIPAASVISLAVFHLTFYGTLLGPYAGGGLEPSTTSVMVTAGLFLDQNHGALLLSPILWAGLPGMVLLWRARWRYALVVLVTVLAVTVPNGSHPNWYGGGSFTGRFALPAILILTIPAAVGLLALARASRRTFWLVIAIAAAVLAWMALWFAVVSGIPGDRSVSGHTLFNRPAETWLSNYSAFWYPVEQWLPALYNVDWAYSYAPNAAWLIVAVGIVALTVAWPRLHQRKLWLGAGAAGAVGLIGLSGVIGGAQSTDAMATGVPVIINKPTETLPTARAFLRHRTFAVELTYSSPLPPEEDVGRWDLLFPETGATLRAGSIPGTGGQTRVLEEVFTYRALSPTLVEARLTIPPKGSVEIVDLRIVER